MAAKEYFAHETAVIDEGCIIGKALKFGIFHILCRLVLSGELQYRAECRYISEVNLGRNVKVQNNVSIYTGVICEDDVFLGPSMVFTNITNPRSAVIRKNMYEKTLVEQGASIGANATVVCGNRIGKYAFIGAGAVVTKDVKPYSLVVGNPAKQVGWMSEFGHKLNFDNEGIAYCPKVMKDMCWLTGWLVKNKFKTGKLLIYDKV